MAGPHHEDRFRLTLPRHVRGAATYLRFNLWSLVPGIAALMILVVLRQTVFLAQICPNAGTLDGNPLFCPNGQVISAMLEHTLGDIRTSLAPPSAPDPQTSLRQSEHDDDAAAAEKAVADAAVAQARARADELGAADPNAKAAIPPAVARQSDVATDAAEKHRVHTERLATAKLASRSHAALFREARARLRWIGSYGAVVAFALGTIIAAFWLWSMAIEDHLFPETATETRRRARQKGVAGLLLLLGVSLVVLFLTWTIGFNLLRATVFRDMGLPGPFDLNLLTFDDAITTFIFGQVTHTGGDFFADGLPLVSGASLLVTIAVAGLGAAVGATLYQTPWQVQAWQQYVAASEPTPKAPTEVHASQPYERFLRRCFQRLNVCIYIGATLMVVCVVHLNAQYSWISALLDPSATEEPWKTALPAAITGFSDELSFQYGLAFSTVLVALFLPSWVILRKRAWAVARAQCVTDTTNAKVQDWLETHGMGFTNVQQYAQILALLAPAGAGVFVSILKVVTGSNS
jgi:hypothetical protein